MEKILFVLDYLEGDLVLTTTPESYWKKKHCVLDIGGTGDAEADKKLNDLGWGEESESLYTNENTNLSKDKAFNDLISAGFIHSQAMEDWLKSLGD